MFYRLLQRLPELAFELAGWPAPDMSGYRFRSEEIKQTALSTGQNFQNQQESLEFIGEVEGDVTQEIEAVAEEGLEGSPKGFFTGIGRSWS